MTEQIANILLIAGAFGAALYCVVLSRRLSRFTDLEKGVGGAVAVLSAQVDEMTRALQSAQSTASGSTVRLETITERADGVARRLELLVASMHDLPGVDAAAAKMSRTGSLRANASGPDTRPRSRAGGARTDDYGPDIGESDGIDADDTLFRSHRNWRTEAAE